MRKVTLKIEGMMCSMCEAHICDAIRKAFPKSKKVSASRRKKEAVFLLEEPVDEKEIREVIEHTGYTFVSVLSVPYKKRGLFG